MILFFLVFGLSIFILVFLIIVSSRHNSQLELIEDQKKIIERRHKEYMLLMKKLEGSEEAYKNLDIRYNNLLDKFVEMSKLFDRAIALKNKE